MDISKVKFATHTNKCPCTACKYRREGRVGPILVDERGNEVRAGHWVIESKVETFVTICAVSTLENVKKVVHVAYQISTFPNEPIERFYPDGAPRANPFDKIYRPSSDFDDYRFIKRLDAKAIAVEEYLKANRKEQED